MRKATFLVLALAATGCLETKIYEDVNVLKTECSGVSVEADNYDLSPLKDTIYITSNRTWTVTMPDSAEEWIELGLKGHENLSGVSETVAIPLYFENNSLKQERTTTLTVHSTEGKMEIPVSQKAIVPRFSIVSTTELEDLSSKGDSVRVEINSNVAWTVKVKDGATASIVLPSAGGSMIGSYKFDVEESMHSDINASGTVVFSAPDCEDVEITVTQQKSTPYLVIEECPTSIAPDSTTFSIPIRTNSSWTAEIASQTGFEDFKIVGESGSYLDHFVRCSFEANTDPRVTKTVKVRVSAPNVEPVEITLTQKGYLHILIHDGKTPSWSYSPSRWPFSYPTSSTTYVPNSGGATMPLINKEQTCTLLNGIEIKIFASKSFYKNSGTGLMLGNVAGDYIKLPGFTGLKVSKLSYTSRAKSGSSKFKVLDEDGKEIGAEQNVMGQGKTFTWNFTGTAAGKGCTMSLTSGNFNVGCIDLFYETTNE